MLVSKGQGHKSKVGKAMERKVVVLVSLRGGDGKMLEVKECGDSVDKVDSDMCSSPGVWSSSQSFMTLILWYQRRT